MPRDEPQFNCSERTRPHPDDAGIPHDDRAARRPTRTSSDHPRRTPCGSSTVCPRCGYPRDRLMHVLGCEAPPPDTDPSSTSADALSPLGRSGRRSGRTSRVDLDRRPPDGDDAVGRQHVDHLAGGGHGIDNAARVGVLPRLNDDGGADDAALGEPVALLHGFVGGERPDDLGAVKVGAHVGHCNETCNETQPGGTENGG
jgi:hypothetical protein